MKHFLACLAFLIGFPLIFGAGECVSQYAEWRLGFGRENPFPSLLEGHFTKGALVWAIVLAGCGIWDIIDMFGGFSDYRKGMRGFLPKHDPLGFVMMRARRYVLVFVVAAAAVVVCKIAPTTREMPPFSRVGLPHVWFGFVALAVARRPLNTEPVLGILIGFLALLKMFDQTTDALTTGKTQNQWD